ncbi:helix-turn-helix domain-containing protein [Pleionea sediminis]|uniref:helix-turn-helix domain-containing protein n=1 Tax=Pleionea sediminis TaxID=2569479 RepID=UPI0011858A82|nr:helix-turn-helix transcriptional regulator [Pleionea sediminis]
MILAEKIVRLRKQVGWSQEELAEKMNVSRQSVSKWESTSSIPDLNKILMLAEIFDVSTDFLLKDETETPAPRNDGLEIKKIQVSLERAVKYVEDKVEMAQIIAKGVFLCIGSTIPLFALLALAKNGVWNLNSDLAAAFGIICILIMAAVGVSFFIRSNQYENEISAIEDEEFELAYGVRSAFKEKLNQFRGTYNLKLAFGIAMFLFCAVPLIVGTVIFKSPGLTLTMLVLTIIMIAIGVYIIIPVSAEFDAYNRILLESESSNSRTRRLKRAEKLAAFYWPLLIAIYLGWSLWTMNWHITWIIFPVAGILFAALIGLMELLDKEDR